MASSHNRQDAMPTLARRIARAAAALALCLQGVGTAAAEITVFAAASLTNAFEEVGALYQARTGRTVRQSFAASSTLAKQLESGAPANIFASADEQWMDWAAQRRLIVPDSRRALLGNRLVLVTAADRPVRVELRPGFDLAALLGANGRLATGDPAHVPAGRYARKALEQLGVWAVAEPRLVRADSVRAALALVERGEVPAGIVYATDAAASRKVRVAAIFPEDAHAPIVYPIALIARQDTADARDFFEFLQGGPAQAVYRKYGFEVRGR